MTDPAARPRSRRVRKTRDRSTCCDSTASTFTTVEGRSPGSVRKLGRPELGFAEPLRRDPVASIPASSRPRGCRPARAPDAGSAGSRLRTGSRTRARRVRRDRAACARRRSARQDDAVAGADLRRLAVEPDEPPASEHVEDLLLAPVLVGGRRPARHPSTWIRLTPILTDPAASPEIRPRALARWPMSCVLSLGFVEVRDAHARDSTTRAAI